MNCCTSCPGDEWDGLWRTRTSSRGIGGATIGSKRLSGPRRTVILSSLVWFSRGPWILRSCFPRTTVISTVSLPAGTNTSRWDDVNPPQVSLSMKEVVDPVNHPPIQVQKIGPISDKKNMSDYIEFYLKSPIEKHSKKKSSPFWFSAVLIWYRADISQKTKIWLHQT